MQAAGLLIRKSNDARINQIHTYKNGGPRRIVSAKKAGEANESLFKQLQKKVQQMFGNSYYRNSTPPFTSEALEVHRIGDSPSDLQVIEDNRYTFEELCRVWRFPVTIADSKSATLDNYAFSLKALYEFCVLPEKQALANVLTEKLCKPYDSSLYVHVETNDIQVLQEDKLKTVQWMKESESYSKNEIRQRMGDEPSEEAGSDQIWVKASSKPMSNALQADPIGELLGGSSEGDE